MYMYMYTHLQKCMLHIPYMYMYVHVRQKNSKQRSNNTVALDHLTTQTHLWVQYIMENSACDFNFSSKSRAKFDTGYLVKSQCCRMCPGM